MKPLSPRAAGARLLMLLLVMLSLRVAHPFHGSKYPRLQGAPALADSRFWQPFVSGVSPAAAAARPTPIVLKGRVTSPLTSFVAALRKSLPRDIRTVPWIALAALALPTKLMRPRPVPTDEAGLEVSWVVDGYGRSLHRALSMWTFAVRFAIQLLRATRWKTKDPIRYSQLLSNLARDAKWKLLQLGPTFIKMGQLLSTRIDVLPKEFVVELSSLQDQVPAFSGDLAVEIVERELGASIEVLFDQFNRTPFAAASLGQVHLADKNGKQYAVKVQRQNLRKLFDADFRHIRRLAKLLDLLDPKADGARKDWLSICDESAKLLYKEIDYRLEAVNSMRFKENFRGVAWVKVPQVLMDRTTSTVITMEYVPGIKISNVSGIAAAGIDRQLLAKRSAESFLRQLCRHGFFHCDPHPGNVACDAAEGGRLIYYDFGMMDELHPTVKKGLVDLLFAVYDKDAKAACDALETIGVLRRGIDRVSVEKIAREFLREFAANAQLDEPETSPPISAAQLREIAKQRRIRLAADLFTLGDDMPFKFPAAFTFVFRALSSLDGVGKGLDPAFDLTRIAKPYLKELLDLRDGSAALTTLKTWQKRLGWTANDVGGVLDQPRNIAKLLSIMERLEQGDLKLRVRVLESERSFKRMQAMQANLFTAVAAVLFFQIANWVASSAPASQPWLWWGLAKTSLAAAVIASGMLPLGMLRLALLDKKIAQCK